MTGAFKILAKGKDSDFIIDVDRRHSCALCWSNSLASVMVLWLTHPQVLLLQHRVLSDRGAFEIFLTQGRGG